MPNIDSLGKCCSYQQLFTTASVRVTGETRHACDSLGALGQEEMVYFLEPVNMFMNSISNEKVSFPCGDAHTRFTKEIQCSTEMTYTGWHGIKCHMLVSH